MDSRITGIARYTLLEALRTRLAALMCVTVLVMLAASFFVETISITEGARFQAPTPLMTLAKAGIIRLGASLGVDFALTHSCYDPAPDGAACGHCDACRLRSRGFREAGIPDPTRYAAATRT